ncbi:MAG: hypothetical protein IPI97_15440 [Nitrosomonas sp.]|nr:hypothetical protein [Nitrosomonas sp.]
MKLRNIPYTTQVHQSRFKNTSTFVRRSLSAMAIGVIYCWVNAYIYSNMAQNRIAANGTSRRF